MKKGLITFLVLTLLTLSITKVTDHAEQDEDIRRPFIPGREQNIF